MKRITLVVVALMALSAFLVSCSKPEVPADPDILYYTCNMHPSVHMKDPKAKCPICGMSLTAVRKSNSKTNSTAPASTNEGPSVSKNSKLSVPGAVAPASAPAGQLESPTEFTVTSDRQQQIGVTYVNVEQSALKTTLRAFGLVEYDKERHWDYVSRVDGYVQKLYIFARGQSVSNGQPLLTIYSPDLLNTEREFLNVLKMREQAQKSGSESSRESAEQLYEATKSRLRLWNIGEAQVQEMEKTRQPQETVTLYSPFAGVVQTLAVDQGRRVMTGEHLVDIADLSRVWVWAEFYQEELALLKQGQTVSIRSSALPEKTFTGKISVIDPFFSENKRTTRVRIDLENPDLVLRPDMYVDVEVDLDLGQALTVPVTAIMPTGLHNVAFVNKGEGKLEPRFVELGRKVGTNFVVQSGLTNGESIVNSANFLIDAEAKVQGALKSF